MGGTFPSLDQEYRDDFVNYVYKAINDFSDEFVIEENGSKKINYDKFNDFFEIKHDNLKSIQRQIRIHEKILKLKEFKALKIGIDIDDVLCFTWNEVISNYNKKYNENLKFEDIKNFNFNGNEKLKEEFFLYDKKFGVEHKPYQNSKEILNKLKKEGHKLSLITSRKDFQKKTTLSWVEKHFGNNFFENIIF